MQTIHFLMVILLTLAVVTILVYKIYKFVRKVNKLYNYFIISEKDKSQKQLSLVAKSVPSINGECPTKEQLENL